MSDVIEKRPAGWEKLKPLDLAGVPWPVHERYEFVDVAGRPRLIAARGPVVRTWSPIRERRLFDFLAKLTKATDEQMLAWCLRHGLPGSHLQGQQVGEDVNEIREMARHLDQCTVVVHGAVSGKPVLRQRVGFGNASAAVGQYLRSLCRVDVVALQDRLQIVLVAPTPFAAAYQRLAASAALGKPDPRTDYHWRALRQCDRCQSWFKPYQRISRWCSSNCRRRGSEGR